MRYERRNNLKTEAQIFPTLVSSDEVIKQLNDKTAGLKGEIEAWEQNYGESTRLPLSVGSSTHQPRRSHGPIARPFATRLGETTENEVSRRSRVV